MTKDFSDADESVEGSEKDSRASADDGEELEKLSEEENTDVQEKDPKDKKND